MGKEGWDWGRDQLDKARGAVGKAREWAFPTPDYSHLHEWDRPGSGYEYLDKGLEPSRKHMEPSVRGSKGTLENTLGRMAMGLGGEEHGYTMNPSKLIRGVYGDQAESEVDKAQAYANEKGLMWGRPKPETGSYLDNFPYNQNIPVYTKSNTGPAWMTNTNSWEDGTLVLPLGAEYPTSPRGLVGMIPGLRDTIEGGAVTSGFGRDPSSRQDTLYGDSQGTLTHEVTGHGLHNYPERKRASILGWDFLTDAQTKQMEGDQTGRSLIAKPDGMDAVLSGRVQVDTPGGPVKNLPTYVETNTQEFPAFASSIQQHLWNERGKRLESPEEYDEWIKSTEHPDFDRSTLPLEVQRWLNQRDLAGEDPDEERRRGRMRYHDGNMRHILPGIVDNRQRNFGKHASSVTEGTMEGYIKGYMSKEGEDDRMTTPLTTTEAVRQVSRRGNPVANRRSPQSPGWLQSFLRSFGRGAPAPSPVVDGAAWQNKGI